MIKIDGDLVVYFDIDDTLVMWRPVREADQTIYLETYGEVPVHREHIKRLKQHKARGHQVVVWSQGGADWAETVVFKLGLEDYVDLVISKPRWHYDDKISSEWLPEIDRVYIPEN